MIVSSNGIKKTKKSTKKKTLAKPTKPDNLKKIEGIGPKIEELLHNAGVLTYAQLAKAKPAKLTLILTEAGSRFAFHDPASWPKQSKMAADGEWEMLKEFQEYLDGGKDKG